MNSFLDTGFLMLDIPVVNGPMILNKRMSYRDLEVWTLARDLSVMVHRMSIENLPKFEMYEAGSQIRRSAKSVRANIVEGYGRRIYKQEFLKHLTYALASCDETMDHLETLWETGSLTDKSVYDNIHEQTDKTGRKLNVFRKSVETGHRSKSGAGIITSVQDPVSE